MKRPRKKKLIEMKMSPQRITELKAIRRSLADRLMDLSLDIRCKRYGMDLRGTFNERSLVQVFESLIAELKLPLADALSALREGSEEGHLKAVDTLRHDASTERGCVV